MTVGLAVFHPMVFATAAGERASSQMVLEKQRQSTTPATVLIIDASLRLNDKKPRVCTCQLSHVLFIVEAKFPSSGSTVLISTSTGRDALKHFHTVSRGMGVTPFHIISIARSQALSKLFNKHTPLPRSERGKEMERVAREEGIRELETAIATVKRMKKAEMEVERRKSF